MKGARSGGPPEIPTTGGKSHDTCDSPDLRTRSGACEQARGAAQEARNLETRPATRAQGPGAAGKALELRKWPRGCARFPNFRTIPEPPHEPEPAREPERAHESGTCRQGPGTCGSRLRAALDSRTSAPFPNLHMSPNSHMSSEPADKALESAREFEPADRTGNCGRDPELRTRPEPWTRREPADETEAHGRGAVREQRRLEVAGNNTGTTGALGSAVKSRDREWIVCAPLAIGGGSVHEHTRRGVHACLSHWSQSVHCYAMPRQTQ